VGRGASDGARGEGRYEVADLLHDLEPGGIVVGAGRDGSALGRAHLQVLERCPADVAGAHQDRDDASLSLRGAGHGAIDVEAHARIRGDERRADEQQDQAGVVDVLGDDGLLVVAGADVGAAPDVERPVADEPCEVIPELFAERSILGGVGDEDVGGGAHGCRIRDRGPPRVWIGSRRAARLGRMALPPLAKRSSDAWDLRAAFEKTTPIFSVSARSGRVLVGGGMLYLLRAGVLGWAHRELPDQVGPLVSSVAVEPRAPYRFAIGTEQGVAIFLGQEGGGDRIAHITPGEEDWTVEGLAWGRVQKRSALFVLWSGGAVGVLFPDTGEGDTLDLPPMVALASDDGGAVAMLCLDEMRAYASLDGQRYSYRPLDPPKDWYDALPDEFDFPFHVAVAGKAVAFSFGSHGAFVSRDLEAKPFVKCEPLADAGALVFEGASPDAALFGAIWTEAFISIVRVDASGNAVRLGDLSVEGAPGVPFDEIAWDASRRRLFAVHGQVGLVVATAPDAKRGKLAMPS
jgi:hypothetical protein